MAEGSLEKLMEVVAQLRDPESGCPWDIEQTPLTLCPMMIEEAYEIVEAIENKDHQNLQEELGDLLLHVVLQAQMASESNLFSMVDVIDGINDKLIRRHPHVFGDVQVEGVDQVLETWDEIKRREKEARGEEPKKKSLSTSLPALMAVKEAVKLREEEPSKTELSLPSDELRRELESLSFEDKRVQVGKVFYQMAQLALEVGINPEEALRSEIQRTQT